MKLVTKLNKLLDSSLIRHSKKSLATKLDNYDKIVSQYPFVEDEGTDITLNNTIEAPMLDIGVKGNSKQVQYSGKNLLAEFEETVNNGVTFKSTDKGILLNGTSSGTSVKTIFEEIITPGTYIINGITGAANNTFQVVVSINGVTKAYVTTNNYSFTLEEGDELKIRLYAYKNYGTFNNLLLPYQLEQGTTATDYEPYVGGTASPNPSYPQEITNVTGDVEVLVQNKNYFDLNKILYGEIDSNGDLSVFASTNDFYKIDFKENTQYTISGYVKRTSGNVRLRCMYTDGTYSEFFNQNASDNFSFSSFTSLANKTIDKIVVYYGSAGYLYIKDGEMQIEENTTATTYTPHKEQTYTFPLGTQRMYLGDYLADDGIHHVRGEYTLPSSATLQTATIFGVSCKYASYKISTMKSQSSVSGDFYCNKIKYSNGAWGKYQGYIIAQNFVVLTDSEDTNENYNSKVGGAVVEYPLAEEEITPYTTEQQKIWNKIKEAMSYYGQTNITSEVEEGNTQPIISAKAMYDLNNLVSRVEQLELEV